MNLHKVRGLYGDDFDPITTEVLFSLNDVKKCFGGNTSEGDWVINIISQIVENHDCKVFSSEKIANCFSSVKNSSYWIQNSFKELANYM